VTKISKYSVLYYGIWVRKCDYGLAFKKSLLLAAINMFLLAEQSGFCSTHTGMGQPTILSKEHQA